MAQHMGIKGNRLAIDGQYIRRPLQSVERVRLHLLAYKATLEEDISPASPGSQAAEI